MNYKILVIGLLLVLGQIQWTLSASVSCDLLKKSLSFYKANRAGRLPDSEISWRGDSALNDAYPAGAKDANGDGNLSGGYYDAGDGVKFGLPMSYSLTMLAWGFLEQESKIAACGLTDYYLDIVKYGTDWLIAAHVSDNEVVHQVGDGNLDHSFWGPPEKMTMARPVLVISAAKPGTEIAMEYASALSAASLIWKDRNPSYAASCLSHAKSLYSFGDTNKGVYSDSFPEVSAFYKSWSGYGDELVWGSVWLYRATGDESYLTKAKAYYTQYELQYKASGTAHSWDNKTPGAMLLMYKATADETYKSHLENHLKDWLPGGSVSRTPGGLAWLMEWGPNRYAINAAFIAQMLGGSKYADFAKSQLDYVLGDNPKQQSFVVGVGSNAPVNPHHRAAHGSTTNNINNPVNNLHILYGALVGGPGKDDSYTDDRTNYITNEVACDYNACFVGLLATYAGGDPAPTEAPTSTPSATPTTAPTEAPTTAPTEAPTTAPTEAPTTAPTEAPTTAPTEAPTTAPTEAPTTAPTEAPTTAPTEAPTTAPTEAPTTAPTEAPTTAPTEAPSTGGSTSFSITVNQVEKASWKNGDDSISQYECELVNQGTATATNVKVTFSDSDNLMDVWELTKVSNGQYELPAWRTYSPLTQGSKHTFGYIVKGSKSTITVSC